MTEIEHYLDKHDEGMAQVVEVVDMCAARRKRPLSSRKIFVRVLRCCSPDWACLSPSRMTRQHNRSEKKVRPRVMRFCFCRSPPCSHRHRGQQSTEPTSSDVLSRQKTCHFLWCVPFCELGASVGDRKLSVFRSCRHLNTFFFERRHLLV